MHASVGGKLVLGSMWEITIQKNVPARMRDGTTLMSDIYRPAGAGAYPVLLSPLPYGKDRPRDPTYFDPVKAAGAGYVVVVQDVRGRSASEGGVAAGGCVACVRDVRARSAPEGEFVPFVNEYEDGYDTVEWAAELPGSDGRVGMFGLSYFGRTQWQAAVMRPPSLKSMVPGITWGNHLNGAQMRGGVQEVGIMHYWAQAAIAPNELFRKYRGEPEKIGERLSELVGVIDAILAGGGYEALPLSDLPNPDGVVPFSRDNLGRGVEDPGWDLLNIDGRYDRVDVPTFHIGGWYDCFIGETIRQYGAMRRRSEGAGIRQPRLLVGPGTHADFGSTFGDLDFGFGSTGGFLNSRGDLTDRHLSWFDATLKGDESALEGSPPVQVFVMGENRWRGYEEWPPPGSHTEDWHLRPGGLLTREPEESGGEPSEYSYDPSDPVLTC